MTADGAFALGCAAGFLALAVWLLWPTKHECQWRERCPHFHRDNDIPL